MIEDLNVHAVVQDELNSFNVVGASSRMEDGAAGLISNCDVSPRPDDLSPDRPRITGPRSQLEEQGPAFRPTRIGIGAGIKATANGTHVAMNNSLDKLLVDIEGLN
jgi:hypothetical protein